MPLPIIDVGPGDDAITLTTMMGTLGINGNTVSVGKRPGVDGNHFRETGEQSPEASLETFMDLVAPGDAKTELERHKAAQGRVCTITDDLGRVWPNQVCIRVISRLEHYKIGVGGQNEGTEGVITEWTFQEAKA